MNKKLVLGAGLAVSLFGVAACGESAQPEPPEAVPSASADQPAEPPEMAEPDLEGVPDVVAEVNGEEIGKDAFVTAYESQFQQMAPQAQMSGQELDQEQLRTQVAENLVGTELIVQEADERGYDVTQGDVDEMLQEFATSNGLESVEEFVAAMGEQGMDEGELTEQVENQIKIEEVIAAESGDVEPSESELRELYDQAVAQQEEMGGQAGEMPAFEDVRPQLEDQVRSQKEAEVVQALLGDLREDADVTIYL